MAEQDKYDEGGIAFICCIESGMLEYKGLCMLLSFRKNWTLYSEVPIYAYSPRRGHEVSEWLKEFYTSLNINLIDIPLNTEFYDYPLANKLLSMAHAEQNLSSEILVFLDSDILCWNSPSRFHIDSQYSMAMVADGTKTVASSGESDRVYEPQWRSLYSLADVKYSPFITTWLTEDRVRGWWNTGVVVFRRRRGLMQEALELFKQAFNSIKFTSDSMYLREQMIICTIAAKYYPEFKQLPISYNYPVQNSGHYSSLGYPASEAVLWHYQPFFNKTFSKFKRKFDQAKSFEQRRNLALGLISDFEMNHASMVGLDETLLQSIRRKAKIGPRLRRLVGKRKTTDPS